MQLTLAKRRSSLQRNRGFTLVEISIVLVIIGLILGGILNAQSVIRNAQTKDAIKALNDMAAAARQFNDRYGMWPGDYSNAATSLPGQIAPCANGGGNGQVSAAESICATQQMILAGMLRGTVSATPLTIRGVQFSIIQATLTGVAAPANWVNVVRVQGIDCDVAVQMDRAMDDGNTNTGNFRTTAGTCGAAGTTQSETIVVADAVLRLN